MRLKRPRINGRRGAFLLLCAGFYALHGSIYFLDRGLPPALEWLAGIPVPFLGFVWLPPAVLALIGVFLARPRDWFSWSALVVAPFTWGGFYVIGAFVTGEVTGALGASLYWLLAGMVIVASGMAGDDDRDLRELEVP